MKDSTQIVVPIMFYIDDNGHKIYAFEEMADYFEQELSKLDDSVVIMCSVENI